MNSPDRDGHLVGGLERGFYDFPIILGIIIPIDELHHFSWLKRVKTTNHQFFLISNLHISSSRGFPRSKHLRYFFSAPQTGSAGFALRPGFRSPALR
jgi:hypothetical protein